MHIKNSILRINKDVIKDKRLFSKFVVNAFNHLSPVVIETEKMSAIGKNAVRGVNDINICCKNIIVLDKLLILRAEDLKMMTAVGMEHDNSSCILSAFELIWLVRSMLMYILYWNLMYYDGAIELLHKKCVWIKELGDDNEVLFMQFIKRCDMSRQKISEWSFETLSMNMREIDKNVLLQKIDACECKRGTLKELMFFIELRVITLSLFEFNLEEIKGSKKWLTSFCDENNDKRVGKISEMGLIYFSRYFTKLNFKISQFYRIKQCNRAEIVQFLDNLSKIGPLQTHAKYVFEIFSFSELMKLASANFKLIVESESRYFESGAYNSIDKELKERVMYTCEDLDYYILKKLQNKKHSSNTLLETDTAVTFNVIPPPPSSYNNRVGNSETIFERIDDVYDLTRCKNENLFRDHVLNKYTPYEFIKYREITLLYNEVIASWNSMKIVDNEMEKLGCLEWQSEQFIWGVSSKLTRQQERLLRSKRLIIRKVFTQYEIIYLHGEDSLRSIVCSNLYEALALQLLNDFLLSDNLGAKHYKLLVQLVEKMSATNYKEYLSKIEINGDKTN